MSEYQTDQLVNVLGAIAAHLDRIAAATEKQLELAERWEAQPMRAPVPDDRTASRLGEDDRRPIMGWTVHDSHGQYGDSVAVTDPEEAWSRVRTLNAYHPGRYQVREVRGDPSGDH